MVSSSDGPRRYSQKLLKCIIKRKEVRTRLVVFTNRQYKRDNGRSSVNKSGSDSNNTPSRCFNDWWRESLGSLVCFFLSFSTH